MDKLAPHLKELRERKGLSQSALGKLVGLGQTHISRLESGTKCISNEKLLAIAEALKGAIAKVDAVLETISHERTVDAAPAKPSVS